MAAKALRVLAVAKKRDATWNNAESRMTFLGLLGMIDPPRPEASPRFKTCEQAGIKVVMITGDHPLTARPSPASWGCSRPTASSPGRSSTALSDATWPATSSKSTSMPASRRLTSCASSPRCKSAATSSR